MADIRLRSGAACVPKGGAVMRKALILALLLLPACRDEAEVAAPEPMTMTAEAVGYFCQMAVLDHAGPKAQIFLKDVLDPLFFGQVSDAVAFRRMPEQAGEIVAIYVSDMGAAPDWARPARITGSRRRTLSS